MTFADLQTDCQLDQVSEALHALLGDTPSQHDYIALCRAVRVIVDALEEAHIDWPLPGWNVARGVVRAA